VVSMGLTSGVGNLLVVGMTYLNKGLIVEVSLELESRYVFCGGIYGIVSFW